jgi:hypothetical protein
MFIEDSLKEFRLCKLNISIGLIGHLDTQILRHIIVNGNRIDLTKRILENEKLFRIGGAHEGIIDMSEYISARLSIDLDKEAWIRCGSLVAVLLEMSSVSFIISSTGVGKAIEILLDSIQLVWIKTESKRNIRRDR